jgi:hypothetical protein
MVYIDMPEILNEVPYGYKYRIWPAGIYIVKVNGQAAKIIKE